MRRQSSLLLLLFASTGAGLQIAACSSDDSSGASSADAGSDSAEVEQDTGTSTPGQGCSGPLPVMTVRLDGGGQGAPDWSCYGSPKAYIDFDDAGDAAVDATDGGLDADTDAADSASPVQTPDAAPDAAPDSATTTAPDSGPPVVDAGSDYLIHLTDFVADAPPVGATVDLFWGGSTTGTPAFTGTVDGTGVLAYPPPPAGTATLSYFIHGSSTQVPLYWHGGVVVPPGVNAPNQGDGRFEGNSVSVSTETLLITSIFGSESPRTDLGILVTDAQDCQGNDVEGAQFAIIDVATGAAIDGQGTGPGSPRSVYFMNNNPVQQCTYTNNIARGVWVMANAPVNEPGSTAQYTLRMTGRRTASDPATGVLIQDTPLELYPGAISVARASVYSGPPPSAGGAAPDGG